MNSKMSLRAYSRTLREGASGRESWRFQAVLGRAVSAVLTVCASLLLLMGSASAATPAASVTVVKKQVIGSTAIVEETESDFTFRARVDTGATTSSMHVEDWKIEDEAEQMPENVGKTIRFRIKNEHGESEWLERKIADTSLIKTSEQQEQRYKVRMTLSCLNVKKRVLVSLNDRSHMTYPMLLGRNFLQGDFVVDVDHGKRQPERKLKAPEQQAEPKPAVSELTPLEEK